MSPYGLPDLDLLLEPLPRPMFPNNYEGRNRMCVYGEVSWQLQAIACGAKGVASGSVMPP